MKALPVWLVLVAVLRLFGASLGYFDINKLKIALIDRRPDLVTPVMGRAFAVWTILTCALCVITARNHLNKPMIIATAISFAVALAVFGVELTVHKTQSWRGLVSPMIIASTSLVWLTTHLLTAQLDESAEGSSVTALRRYLYVLALGRLWSVYEALLNPKQYGQYLFPLKPDQGNELALRLLAAWMVVSIALALVCSQNPTDPPVYGAMLASSVLGVFYYASEVWLFKSSTLHATRWHLAINGLTALWMGLFWNYYTKYSKIVPLAAKQHAA